MEWAEAGGLPLAAEVRAEVSGRSEARLEGPTETGDNPPMFALYEDAGKFLAGRVMSEAESSLQIELDSGKRVKVKSANVLLKFDQPPPAQLLAEGQRLAGEIDLDLAWEFAPADEFGFADVARDYFDAKAGVVQQAAALFRLFEAPHYFRRVGRGRFKKAPEDIVKAALLGIERKKPAGPDRGVGATSWSRAAAPSRSASSSIASSSIPTRTASSTRPWWRRAKRAQRRRSIC